MSANGTDEAGKGDRPKFEIYRRKDARDYAEHNVLAYSDVTPTIMEGLGKFSQASAVTGQTVTLLYATPGFSLSHVWFKSGYPLALHSHHSDCLYYILAGSLKIGTEVLGPGDGFFVGEDVPYTYTPGQKGVEVLEFRATDNLDIRFLAKTQKAWDKIAETARERQADWATEGPPTGAGAAG